jgi:hypothetical protein
MADKMGIYVVTRGRPNRANQHTLNNLPDKWVERTVVVCPKEERKFFENNYDVMVFTPRVMNITAKRKWIFENTPYEKILMLDDDLRFHVRPKPLKEPKLVAPDRNDPLLVGMFDKLDKKLDTYAHVGISDRFMNHVVEGEWKETCKALHALGWHVPTVLAHCKLDRVMCGVEHDITLQLFEAGYPNAVYFWGTQSEPAGRAAPGGTSLYRTSKMIWNSARIMERKHPGIVRIMPIVDKDKKALPTIRIAWRKALSPLHLPLVRGK